MLYDVRSLHTANPPAGLLSSSPYDPNSIIIQQSPSSAPSPWRQLPPLDFTRPGRVSLSILKLNLFGDPGLPLPRFYPSNVSGPIVSNIITSNRLTDMSDRHGHGLVGEMIPGFRRITVGYESGHALDPQQQMYENPLMASEDGSHQASPRQQMQSNTQLMTRENRGHPASPQEYLCDQCFEWHVDLASHRETHLEAERFTCRYCKKRYTIDDLAASFSPLTKETLINTFHRRISQPTNATMGIEKTNRCLSNDNNILYLLKSSSP